MMAKIAFISGPVNGLIRLSTFSMMNIYSFFRVSATNALVIVLYLLGSLCYRTITGKDRAIV